VRLGDKSFNRTNVGLKPATEDFVAVAVPAFNRTNVGLKLPSVVTL